MNKQELYEFILDHKERGKESFDALDDDKQNVIVSALILDLPAYRRFECIEDITMDQLLTMVCYNAQTDHAETRAANHCYQQIGKIVSDIFKQNMLKLCEAEYENTVPDYEAANIDDRIDAIQARRFA
jgi:hypothetical protein